MIHEGRIHEGRKMVKAKYQLLMKLTRATQECFNGPLLQGGVLILVAVPRVGCSRQKGPSFGGCSCALLDHLLG